jgi:hypothetical protein
VYIVLTGHDEIVATYHGGKYADGTPIAKLHVVGLETDPNEYVVVWQAVGEDKMFEVEQADRYHLVWKGDYKACAKQFMEITDDLEAEKTAPPDVTHPTAPEFTLSQGK